ncbi:putative RNA polymerase II subunit B1 CTD phosphatase rpap2 [Thunnus maccoyii]|uniref:putative RNA polymerase II subunit B1 CTD phosphatase rpap2 n=1 Tax=Thunnus maccoyii TaxID=8240 RepID=UPI001C4BC144|nr:putative RNA polymerase II subunit B1 CTD phosphatase rpap2 [Thunnus maccoyii]
METVGRRSSGGASKTSKKGGKRVKALSAEEEARRREEIREKLQEKLELEKRALQVVERLLEDSVADDFLVDCARFITSDNYKDAVEERSIAKLCGYPTCPNKLGKISTQQYKICTKTNKVYDITERKCFCSNFCYKASKEFELQISKTPLWLRQHESPAEIKLMKKGDDGSSGEEVRLSEKRLQEQDIENPLTAQPEETLGSQQRSAAAGLSHSDSSDAEQEQDFVSSVVSQRQGPRVHWGDLPKRTDEDEKGDRGKMQRRAKQNREGEKEELQRHESQNAEKEGKMKEDENRRPRETEKPKAQLSGEQAPKEEGGCIEEATAKMNLCSLSEPVTHTAPSPVDSNPSQADHTSPVTSPPLIESNPSTETRPQADLPSSTLTAGLNITEVGMSRRGAAGLRDLLKNHSAEAKPNSIRLNLLEYLRRTLKEWSTDETLRFLYGAEHSLGSPFADVKEEKKEEDEELDEDDLEDEVSEEDGGGVDVGVQKRPSAAAPDFKMLRKETQQLELRVREFYKGTWILPEEVKELNGNKVTVQNKSTKDPVLPLVDSQAQHLIQKRITVEKLTSCLRNIVGPLRLTMSDVTTDLNNLVRTFRFTNTNIIHKTPEWTLIAVILLHLLSDVSPVVREALETPASVVYLNTLIEELGLQEQDLLNLVQLFKSPAC